MIYKLTLPIVDRQTVKLPYNARILSAQLQYDQLRVWYQFDLETAAEIRNTQLTEVQFLIIGTGNACTIEQESQLAESVFLGTVQQTPFVWHVFYKLM